VRCWNAKVIPEPSSVPRTAIPLAMMVSTPQAHHDLPGPEALNPTPAPKRLRPGRRCSREQKREAGH
jgi:hypothetical protein